MPTGPKNNCNCQITKKLSETKTEISRSQIFKSHDKIWVVKGMCGKLSKVCEFRPTVPALKL